MSYARILIVDDREDNLYLMRSLLGDNGFSLVEARNGAEALDLLAKEPTDLIITDILMPVMDGFTLCRECKKDPRLQHIPLIFYSATYTDQRDRDFALSLGAARFIVKPEEPEAFLRAIREILEEHPALISASAPPVDEHLYLEQYNAALIRKLEERSERLAQTNAELEKAVEQSRDLSRELQLQTDQMRLLMNNLPGMVYRCRNTEDWTMLFISEGCRPLTGYAAADLIGNRKTSYASLIHGDDRAYVWETIQETVRQRKIFELTYRIRTASGEEKWVFERGQGMFDNKTGELLSIEGFIEDISVQQRAIQNEQSQLDELRRWHSATLGRETRVLELKREVNLLLAELGRPARYASAADPLPGHADPVSTEGDPPRS